MLSMSRPNPLARALSFALAALVLPSVAHPAAPAAAAEPTRLDQIVVVARRVPEPLSQVVSSVSLIDREQFESRLAVDAADLLRYVPGLHMDSEPSRFGAQGVSIRGLGGNRVRVEIDGVPLPDAFAVGQFAAAGRDLGELASIERIEVLRGPASTLYGSDALAGIVAIRTRDPQSLLSMSGGDRHFGLQTGYAGRDASRQLGFSHAFAGAQGLEGLLVASLRQAGTPGNRGETPAEDANPSDRLARSLLGKLGRGFGAHGHWQLGFEHQRSAVETDVVSQHFAPGRFATTYRLLGDDAQRRNRVSVASRWEAPLFGFERVEALLYTQDSATRQDTEQFRLADRATPFASLRWRRFEFEQRDLGLDLLGTRSFRTGALSHELLAGLELERRRYQGQRDGTETNLLTGGTSTIVLGERFPVRDFPTSVSERLAVFVQDEISLGRFALIPGLRFDQYRLDARPDAMFIEDYPEVEVVDGREDSLTSKLGLRFAASERSQLFLQYAQGFRAAPFSDLNIGLSLTLLNYEVRPNPALKPETSRGLEAGWRFSGERMHASVSVYRNDYRDLIESRANLGIDPSSGALVFQSVNRDRARIEGIEAELDLDLAGLNARLEGFSLNAALAMADGDDSRRQQPLNSVDPDTAVFGLNYAAGSGRWGAELIATGVRAKRALDESAGALFAPPGHAVIDAFVWMQLHERLRLNLGAFNLGDRAYWRWATVRGLAANVTNAGFYTQPGRSLSVSLALQF
ncbi:TonB-dependent hemoglobin/transferrin/lactoferrin family receptor [Aquimonas sp.]|jgi:hemoglobin/transferrin/lactoferrin receptor protein|uniref:TonB-dependent hemoglobin/transferrin/lactoferrin family receptor n=1 Tax=Aquimonas sp. TaxID=1872588 RepID=UPI0037BFC3E6